MQGAAKEPLQVLWEIPGLPEYPQGFPSIFPRPSLSLSSVFPVLSTISAAHTDAMCQTLAIICSLLFAGSVGS